MKIAPYRNLLGEPAEPPVTARRGSRQGVKGRTFGDLYKEKKEEPTPLQAWVDDICEVTRRTPPAVRAWAVGLYQPDPLAKQQLAEHLGIDADVLFPPEEVAEKTQGHP